MYVHVCLYATVCRKPAAAISTQHQPTAGSNSQQPIGSRPQAAASRHHAAPNGSRKGAESPKPRAHELCTPSPKRSLICSCLHVSKRSCNQCFADTINQRFIHIRMYAVSMYVVICMYVITT